MLNENDIFSRFFYLFFLINSFIEFAFKLLYHSLLDTDIPFPWLYAYAKNGNKMRSKLNKENIILYVDSRLISPYAMSVFVTLTEKNLPFQIRKVNLAEKENLESEYANLSLTQRVPTLVHGEFHLSESSAISEYLDELYPAPDYSIVYPGDIQLKARARQIQAWIRSDFLAIREERSTEVVFGRPISKPLSKASQLDAAKLFAAADKLIKEKVPNLFDDWCIADTDLALMLNRLILNGDYVPEKLVNYARYQWERPSVRLWVNRERSLKR